MKYKSWICFMPASGSFSLSLWSKYWQRISPQKACFYSLKLPRIRSLAESMFLSYIQKLNLVLFPNSAYNKRADNQLSSRCLHLIRWILSPAKLLPQLLDQRLLNSFGFYCEYIFLFDHSAQSYCFIMLGVWWDVKTWKWIIWAHFSKPKWILLIVDYDNISFRF